ncbi:MAG: ABC transporter ATP-binding protein [Deltaproteobacteria bacterium]|nr:MAG: ABC transporter ATP-binding protein [Deltaproteobacteria bacterium]
MAAPLVEIQSLSKDYYLDGRRIPVLTGVDLSIEAGELVSLTGKSGAGKSTLLHILGTLDHPTSGTVRFAGQDVFDRNESDLADFRARSIGFVFQFHYLLREFTALENTMIPALIQRLPQAEAARRARAILDRVGLSHRLDHKPSELSGGEQQRVALARALIMEPKLLLADEPTGNLDVTTSEGIHDLLFQMNEEMGITAVVVTHNPDLAGRMPRRLRLAGGQVEELS